jgi:tripeptide aminopeptidase
MDTDVPSSSHVARRFLDYVRVETRAVLECSDRPSCAGQRELAQRISKELSGFDSAPGIRELSDGGLLVSIPPSPGNEEAVRPLFAAHLDTAFVLPGAAKPIVHEYSGGDIVLPEESVVIPAEDLVGLAGKRIVTSDGSSLLGADNKAGVAALTTLAEILLGSDAVHGPVDLWFAVDEEIGRMDPSVFTRREIEDWDILWTVDGLELGTLDVGSLDIHLAKFAFIGNEAHPCIDGARLRPAHYAAARLIGLSQALGTPMSAGARDPIVYFHEINGGADRAQLSARIVSFDGEESARMATELGRLADTVSTEYGLRVEIDLSHRCANIARAIGAHRELVEPGFAALGRAGFSAHGREVRGGTDGGMFNLTFPDLPAPNLGTGTRNVHSRREILVLDELEMLPAILADMAAGYAEMPKMRR